MQPSACMKALLRKPALRAFQFFRMDFQYRKGRNGSTKPLWSMRSLPALVLAKGHWRTDEFEQVFGVHAALGPSLCRSLPCKRWFADLKGEIASRLAPTEKSLNRL